jgi:hypothetical protein
LPRQQSPPLFITPPPAANHTRYFRVPPNHVVDRNVHTILDPRNHVRALLAFSPLCAVKAPFTDDLRAARMNTAADLVEGSFNETLTYYSFSDVHWRKIRTNNTLERIRRPVMPQPGGRAAALDRRPGMVRQVLHEYATSLSTAGHANRSRRLITGRSTYAKDSGYFLA